MSKLSLVFEAANCLIDLANKINEASKQQASEMDAVVDRFETRINNDINSKQQLLAARKTAIARLEAISHRYGNTRMMASYVEIVNRLAKEWLAGAAHTPEKE